MTDLLSAIWVLLFGGIAVFLLLTLLRVLRNGHRMADVTLNSGFTFKAWLTGSLPDPGHHPTYLTQSTGMRARVTKDGRFIITPTRTLSRLEF
jgi:hypothetical protein